MKLHAMHYGTICRSLQGYETYLRQVRSSQDLEGRMKMDLELRKVEAALQDLKRCKLDIVDGYSLELYGEVV